MRKSLIPIFTILLFATGCTETEETGFLGEWEGTTQMIGSLGDFVESEIDATITSKGELLRECTINSNQLTVTFIASQEENFLTYKNAEVTNLSDTTIQTYITGNAKLVGDTLIIFDQEVFVMKGSSVISSEDFTYEMKKKE